VMLRSGSTCGMSVTSGPQRLAIPSVKVEATRRQPRVGGNGFLLEHHEHERA
jgi:hypothetical protein